MKIHLNQAASLAVGVIMTSFFVGACWCTYVHDSFMPTKLGTHVHPRVDNTLGIPKDIEHKISGTPYGSHD